MKPGDSVSRSLIAEVRGVSPMFLPPLQPSVTVDGIAAYPDAPQVSESEDRGVFTGSRMERVTLVAEGGGRGEAPAVNLSWYNLATSQVETAIAEGFDIVIDGPPATRAEPRDWRLLGLTALGGLLALWLCLWLLRRLLPPLRRRWAERRAARLASEGYAYRRLREVVDRHDNRALRPALDLWAARLAGPDPRQQASLQQALAAVGATRYGPQGLTDDTAAWLALGKALDAARDSSRKKTGHAGWLPPLNPGWALSSARMKE